MNLGILAKRAGKVAADNSPAILTAIGVSGVITTAYLTGKASFKSADIIREHERNLYQEEKSAPLELKDKFELVWKEFVPAASMGIVSIVAIIGANHIGNRRAAALASAYSITEKAFNEYKEKVVEKMGEKKEQLVRDEISQDRINEHPVDRTTLIVSGTGETLCYDMWTDRYFNSDVESLRKAENDINARIINENYASLSDFWDIIGLPHTSESDDIGWSSDKLLSLEFSAAIAKDNRPCITIGFRTTPDRSFHSAF